jgi:hypothetical protein
MFLYWIFSPHYIFLWPEDGPKWPKHVVSLINRIQRQLCFDVPLPLLTGIPLTRRIKNRLKSTPPPTCVNRQRSCFHILGHPRKDGGSWQIRHILQWPLFCPPVVSLLQFKPTNAHSTVLLHCRQLLHVMFPGLTSTSSACTRSHIKRLTSTLSSCTQNCSPLTVHIRSDIYSTLKSFWRFYVQDASVLEGRFIQFVVLPDDDGLVRLETRTRRCWLTI